MYVADPVDYKRLENVVDANFDHFFTCLQLKKEGTRSTGIEFILPRLGRKTHFQIQLDHQNCIFPLVYLTPVFTNNIFFFRLNMLSLVYFQNVDIKTGRNF